MLQLVFMDTKIIFVHQKINCLSYVPALFVPTEGNKVGSITKRKVVKAN